MNSHTQISPRPLWFKLLILTAIVLGALMFAQGLSVLLIRLFWGIDQYALGLILQNPPAENAEAARQAIFFMQGFSSLGGLFGGAWLYWQFVEKNTWADFHSVAATQKQGLFLAFFIIIAMMPFTAWLAWLNNALEMPAFLSGFEAEAKAKEESLKALTMFLTKIDTWEMFLAGLLVIAVIPALGEEVLFRGVLQNIFQKSFGHTQPHVAIWLAAFVFSAIHLQFYGLVPRMLLGALFGYLYVWSGNLWYPIVAHFANNSITLLAIFLYHQGATDTNIESVEAVAWWAALLSALFTGLLVYVFKKMQQDQAPALHESPKEEAL
jgi:membrane protease YdiL (CAAX protease family)